MSKNERAERDRLMRILMTIVAIWGALLSVGALLFGIDDQGSVSFAIQPLRGAIAFACVLGFLGVWAVTNWWWPRRLARREAAAARRLQLEQSQENVEAGSDEAGPDESDSGQN